AGERGGQRGRAQTFKARSELVRGSPRASARLRPFNPQRHSRRIAAEETGRPGEDSLADDQRKSARIDARRFVGANVLSQLDNLLPMLEPEALVRVASPKAVKAGQELFKNAAVTDIVIDGDVVRGKVKGSHPLPHTTTLKRGTTGAGKS